MEAEKNNPTSCKVKCHEKYNVNNKLFKANKKRIRKARNCLLGIENSSSESQLKDNIKDFSKWDSLFWKKELNEAMEKIKESTKENERLKDLFICQKQEFDATKLEKRELEKVVESHKLTIHSLEQAVKELESSKKNSASEGSQTIMIKNQAQELELIKMEKRELEIFIEKKESSIQTLKQVVNKLKKRNIYSVSESSQLMVEKNKKLSAELRQQRAKNRQLKSQLNEFHEKKQGNKEEKDKTLIKCDKSEVVNIKIKKETKMSRNKKTKQGMNQLNFHKRGWCPRTGKGQQLMVLEAVNEYFWLATCQGKGKQKKTSVRQVRHK